MILFFKLVLHPWIVRSMADLEGVYFKAAQYTHRSRKENPGKWPNKITNTNTSPHKNRFNEVVSELRA